MAKRDVDMRRRVLFITHAEVVIDPAIPVPQWTLSVTGRSRHQAFNRYGPVACIRTIYCSEEQKAIDAAAILSDATGARPLRVRDLHENDRSATGYLPNTAFEAMADRFFAEPHNSVCGWERAVDARARIVRCVTGLVAADTSGGDIAIVAHGGVGALLLGHLLRAPITRRLDQPGRGGGNWFAFDARSHAVIHGWRNISGWRDIGRSTMQAD